MAVREHGGAAEPGARRQADRRAPADDRILPATRLLGAVIVPFLLIAFSILFLHPEDTERLFAWGISPPMTAMVLGSVYLGGAVFFLVVIRATQWHAVRAGFVPVASFASLLGVATLLHWDRFTPGHVSFVAWASLYFLAPPLVVAAFVVNDRRRPPAQPDEPVLPSSTRWVVGGIGAIAAAWGLFMFVAPAEVLEWWPWTLTPLTARVLGASFTLGLAGVLVAVDPRWSAARLQLVVAAVMSALFLASGVRAAPHLDAANPLLWLLAAGMAALLVGSTALLLLRPPPGRTPTS